MNEEIKNSIWPNGMTVDENGYAIFYPMGTNKVEIPKNSPHWPKGNKLVGQFVYEDDKLVGFCDTKAMTTEDTGIVIMPYDYIDTEFDSIEKDSIQIHAPKATVKKASWTGSVKENIPDVQYKYKGCKNIAAIKTKDENYLENDIVDGKWTELLSDLTAGNEIFYKCLALSIFESDLSALTHAYQMFDGCDNLVEFTADMKSLTYAYGAFNGCDNLVVFNSDLSSINDSRRMFYKCSNLMSFDVDLSSLTRGDLMFYSCSSLGIFKSDLKSLTIGSGMFDSCSNLTSFNSNLSSLITADYMFHNCYNLKSFKSDLNSLTNGNSLFQNCSNLTSFDANLGSLETAQYIFSGCKLDAPSIKNVIGTINKIDSLNLLSIGMGCDNNQTDKDLFAQEVGYPYMTSLLKTLQSKGWTVSAQYNGRPSTTFSLRKPESLPIYAKLIEVIPSEEDKYTHYEYTSLDSSKFYNLDWFHETTGSTDGYIQFHSLEEAITNFNIKQIEK